MAAWTVRLTFQADRDIEDILAWTEERFGMQQSKAYAEVLTLALQALVDGPDVIGVKERHDIHPSIRVLHVARYGKRGRHFLVFSAGDSGTIDVLRVLHDSMDLVQHLEP